MQTEDSQKIVRRFFQALYYLKEQGKIRGKQTFTRDHDINRWNLNSLEKDPSRDIFQPAWLTYLVIDYGVSAQWLLTGRGEILTQKKEAAKPEITHPTLKKIYDCLMDQSLSTEEIIIKTGLTAAEASAALVLGCLKGILDKSADDRYFIK